MATASEPTASPAPPPIAKPATIGTAIATITKRQHPGRHARRLHDRVGIVEPLALLGVELPRLVHGAALDLPQLRHVAAHVLALGVEAMRLPQRVEDRLGRVSLPVPATHCQLPLLLARSASASSVSKWAAPIRQSSRIVLVR